MSKVNFNPGPSYINPEVLELFLIEGYGVDGFMRQGIPIGSISHRSQVFLDELLNPLNALVKELLNVPDNYSIIWSRDGATEQWARIARNFGERGGINYVDTGDFAKRAIQAASQIHPDNVNGVINSDEVSSFIPYFVPFNKDNASDLFHITWNNTVEGTEFSDAHLSSYSDYTIIADATSNIFSRPIEWEKHNFGMVYASTGKNLGESGNCLIIIRNDLLEYIPNQGLADSENYKVLVKKDSGLYTNNVSSLLLVYNTLQWLKFQGGITTINEWNVSKAAILYDLIDKSEGFYKPHAMDTCRSNMNVVFYLKDSNLFEEFLTEAVHANLVGLKGHKNLPYSLRASIYNMMPYVDVVRLRNFMSNFMKQYK